MVNSDVRLYWSKSEGRKEVNFNNTPFSVKETRVLDCQFGQKYYKQKPKQGKKMWLQGTRKKGCMAHIEVKTFTLYPQYAIKDDEKKHNSKWKLRCLKEENNSSPDVKLPISGLPFTAGHLEIAHSSTGDHYDSVVPYSEHSSPLQSPAITQRLVASIDLIS